MRIRGNYLSKQRGFVQIRDLGLQVAGFSGFGQGHKPRLTGQGES